MSQDWKNRWEGKWVVITGASAGIGLEFAKLLAAAGANLVLTARRTDRLQQTATGLKSAHNVNVEVFSADLTQPAASAQIHAFTAGKKIEVEFLINNAGFALYGVFESLDDPDIRRMFDTNLFGVMNVIRGILPHFRSRKAGHIVNISSGGGIFSLPAMSLYCASKFALEGFSEEEVAYILAADVAEIRRLADIAGREMAAEIATDVLIIEDETFIAMDLESLVRNLGHNVIGVARTHSDAVALAKNKKPGLILADIQLADGSSGLDAVNELLKVFEVPVVFITAYPERFLTGERPEPAFLISKPFQPAMVSAVASQALFFQRNSRNRAPRVA